MLALRFNRFLLAARGGGMVRFFAGGSGGCCGLVEGGRLCDGEGHWIPGELLLASLSVPAVCGGGG